MVDEKMAWNRSASTNRQLDTKSSNLLIFLPATELKPISEFQDNQKKEIKTCEDQDCKGLGTPRTVEKSQEDLNLPEQEMLGDLKFIELELEYILNQKK